MTTENETPAVAQPCTGCPCCPADLCEMAHATRLSCSTLAEAATTPFALIAPCPCSKGLR